MRAEAVPGEDPQTLPPPEALAPQGSSGVWAAVSAAASPGDRYKYLVHGVDGRTLVSRLDLEGLETSAGSACASGSLEPSHVLRAMGRSEDDARAGLRVSFSPTTNPQDVRGAVEILRRTLLSIHNSR